MKNLLLKLLNRKWILVYTFYRSVLPTIKTYLTNAKKDCTLKYVLLSKSSSLKPASHQKADFNFQHKVLQMGSAWLKGALLKA